MKKPNAWGWSVMLIALIFAVEMALLVKEGMDFARAGKGATRARAELERLTTRRPYPSDVNLRRAENERDEFEYLLGELRAELASAGPLVDMEPADFSAMAQQAVEQFKRRTTAAGVLVPDTLEVGFARYASGGELPAPRDTPRLARQLRAVEHVTAALIAAGVESIDALGRELFEVERTLHETVEAETALPEPGAKGERVTVSFTAREESVWRVLDLLIESPCFLIVDEFSHDTQSHITEHTAADDQSAFTKESVLVGDKALSRSDRKIAGDEVIHVSMSVVALDFREGTR